MTSFSWEGLEERLAAVFAQNDRSWPPTPDATLAILMSSRVREDPRAVVFPVIASEVIHESGSSVILAMVLDELSEAERSKLRSEVPDANFSDVWRLYVVGGRGFRSYMLRSMDRQYLRNRLSTVVDDVTHDFD